MSARYFVTPAARFDLMEIDAQLAKENPMEAAKVCAQLQTAMRTIAARPAQGALRRDLGREAVRIWTSAGRLIVYRAEPSPVQIVRVLPG